MSPDGQEQGEGIPEAEEEEGWRGGPGVGTLGPGVEAGDRNWARTQLEQTSPRISRAQGGRWTFCGPIGSRNRSVPGSRAEPG